jgi:amino acid transporter
MTERTDRPDRPDDAHTDAVTRDAHGHGAHVAQPGTDHRTDETLVQERPTTDKPSERPVRDPRGPGTTFFTNHPDDVVAREKDAYGGVKIGAAFFGWLSAVGLLVILLGLLSAAGAAFGLATGDTANEVVEGQDPTTIGAVAAVVLLLVLFIAYFGGGYVAGRMARFDGAKQGFAVWLWALVVAIAVAVLGAVAGDRFDVLAQVNLFPRIPVNEGDLTTAGVIAAVLAVVATLGGAVLGGLAGTRYHRKVDRVGLLTEPEATVR